jgi:hypothetical protein
MTPTTTSTTMVTTPATPAGKLKAIHRQNCRSFLSIASYWASQGDWDRATGALRAAFRAATKAHMFSTAGRTLVAIRCCRRAAMAEVA